MTNRTCTFPDCNRPHDSKGHCKRHAIQRRAGKGLTPIRSREKSLSIEERFEKRVVRQDGCWAWSGYQDVFGYSTFTFGKRTIFAHRFAWEQIHGPVPEKLELDHICRLRSCVNPDHLRPITRKQNQEHRKGAQKNNQSTGVLGVSWDKRGKNYRARVRSMGKTLFEESFATLEDAEAAVVEARNRFFTHNDVDRVKA